MIQSLVTDLIGETAGSFQAIAVTLTYSMSEMLAIELFESLTQAGTDEDSVVEVLLSRTNDELNAINNDFLASKKQNYIYFIFVNKKIIIFFLLI